MANGTAIGGTSKGGPNQNQVFFAVFDLFAMLGGFCGRGAAVQYINQILSQENILYGRIN